MKTILQNKKECYICGKEVGLHDHHIYFSKNRKNSEKHGLKVWLCQFHHQDSKYGVHFNRKFDKELKKKAQLKFEETHTRKEFLEIFFKNYLD